MLVYDFIFTAADYSGTTAHIYGLGGVEIAESPVTLDASGRFSLSLAEGTYYAVTSSPRRGLNNAQASGVLNVVASITAGGGGVVIDADSVFFEINEGLDILPNSSTVLTWDTLPDGYSGDPAMIALAEGLYHVSLYAEIATPAELRTVTASISSASSIASNSGPFTISPEATNPYAFTIEASGVAIIRPLGGIQIALNCAVLDAAPDPADISIGYAAATFTPIG